MTLPSQEEIVMHNQKLQVLTRIAIALETLARSIGEDEEGLAYLHVEKRES